MYRNLKCKLLITCSLICVYIFFHNNLYALTQRKVGEAIATFAINFEKSADGESWVYDTTFAHRGAAYNGKKMGDGSFHGDCVGWVSFCLHNSIGLDDPGVSSGGIGFVVPTKYDSYITYTGRRNGTVISKVSGGLMPGDILQNSHHVMIYAGNINGQDMLVHSINARDGDDLRYESFAAYASYNTTSGSDINGVYTNVWRVTGQHAETLTDVNLHTTWNGSSGDYSFGSSSSMSGTSNIEDYEGYPDYVVSGDDTKKNYRIANPNDKLPIYKHILLTEKYNFNNIQWKRYGHGHEGDSSPTKDDLTLGLRYPSDDNGTKLGKFVSLVQPYLQTWYIPLRYVFWNIDIFKWWTFKWQCLYR